MKMNKLQQVTKAICNKGLNGNSSILLCSIFGVVRQKSNPQSLLHIALTFMCNIVELS